MSSNIENQVNPFWDMYKYAEKNVYEYPMQFLLHSSDDLTEDAVKYLTVKFLYHAFTKYSVTTAALPLAIPIYYLTNKIGDNLGEIVEDKIKAWQGIDTENASYYKKDRGVFLSLLEEVVDDISEDVIKVSGMLWDNSFEVCLYYIAEILSDNKNTLPASNNLPYFLKLYSQVSGVHGFMKNYNWWNEYSNKAGNFIAEKTIDAIESAYWSTPDEIQGYCSVEYDEYT